MKRHDFLGKTVLITGASTGIGRALTVEFSRRGAQLALCALPQEKDLLERLAAELGRDHGTQTTIVPEDLLDRDAPDRLYAAAKRAFGVPYALVNNAGTIIYGRTWESSTEAQLKIYRLNLEVPFRLMMLALPDMVARGEGVVLNVGSVAAFQPTPFQAVYGSAKSGLQMVSEAARAELAGTGVSVCTLNPPYTDTALLRVHGFPRRIRWYRLGGGLKSPEWVARKGVRALERDRAVYVPGLWPAFLHLFLNRLTPRRLTSLIASWGLKGKAGGDTY